MALTQVKTSGIADDAVTLAKQAGGTDGQVITYDASGNPVAVGPGTDGQVLTSTGAGSPPAFETINTSSAEIYGFVKNGNNLNVTTTNGGADNISGATYAAFNEAFFAATGFSWSINASGNLIATI